MEWLTLHRRDRTCLSKYIINLKLTKYSRWKLSGWLVFNLVWLELTVITGQFDVLFRQAYRKVTARKQRSMQVSKLEWKLVEEVLSDM